MTVILRCFAHHALGCTRPECQPELRWRLVNVEAATVEGMPAKPYRWLYRPKGSPGVPA